MNLKQFLIVLLILYLKVRYSLCLGNNSFANCTMYRDKFSKYASEFTTCAITNARPVTLCESCVNVYINVLNSYENMSKFTDEDGPCITNYINLDRLQILETTYRSNYDLWIRAKCNECFEIENGTLTNKTSEKTKKFNYLLSKTLECIDHVNKTGGNSTVVCNTCMETYVELNDFYYNIINENDKIAGCMDVVDLMNGTRSYWSKTCCQYRKKSEYIFIISTVSMFLLTIFFYILAKLCTDKKSPMIFQQSRFAESLNQTS